MCGGQVIYYGFGQFVGYLIIDLNFDWWDLRCYVSDFEYVMIVVFFEFGVEVQGVFDCECIGVWVGDVKIVLIGVYVKCWVIMYGFVMNLYMDFDYFLGIVVCGLLSVMMILVEEFIGYKVEFVDVVVFCVCYFVQCFE